MNRKWICSLAAPIVALVLLATVGFAQQVEHLNDVWYLTNANSTSTSVSWIQANITGNAPATPVLSLGCLQSHREQNDCVRRCRRLR